MIKPRNKRVLIQKKVEEIVTSSGIEIVATAKTTRNTTISEGRVVAVYEGCEIPVDSVVIFDEGWGNEVETGLFLVSEDSVHAYVA